MPGRFCNSAVVALLLSAWASCAQAQEVVASGPKADSIDPSNAEALFVVCDPVDALRPAAEEIAQQERGRVLDSWPVPDGGYAMWVIEPGRLSDRVVVEFARLWRDRFPRTAVGLITGRTQEQSLALWRRAREAQGIPSASFVQASGVTRSAFLEALRGSGYVTFAGHGGSTFLQLSDSTLRSGDLPPLSGVVIGTESCNVFHPWENDSIALAFAEKGAAAFAGFVYSPDSGYLMGCYDGLPLRFAFPEFPVGRVIQLQNQSAMQGIMALPVYLLLGDPRMALASRPPYRVLSIETTPESRLVRLANAMPGIIPVRIQNGAGYSRMEASGSSATQGYPFYNSRLQAMDIGEDKFLLVDQAGGALTLQLWRQTPLSWTASTTIRDALDQTMTFIAAGGFAFIGSLVALMAVVVVNPGSRALAAGMVSGAALALLHALWVIARLGHVTVTSKPIIFSWPAILGTFILMAGCSAIYLGSRKWSGRIFAILLAASLAWLPEALYLAYRAFANLTVFRPRVGIGIYNYNTAILSACSTTIIAILFMGILIPLRRLVR